MTDDRQTDHATEKRVPVFEIACTAEAIPPKLFDSETSGLFWLMLLQLREIVESAGWNGGGGSSSESMQRLPVSWRLGARHDVQRTLHVPHRRPTQTPPLIIVARRPDKVREGKF